MGESEKLKKEVEYGARVAFLHLEITLLFAKLCYAFEENLFFSATIVL